MATAALILAVLVVRLVYLIWLTPWQLLGDEAYYWQQARHLDWCYNEKGPLLAWMIWPCLKILGGTEWAVRLPMVIAFAVSAWGVGRLTRAVCGRNPRVEFFAVAVFCLLPAFAANAQICTQDGPLIAVWLALTAIGLRLIRRWHQGRNIWMDWMLLWATLGIGFLLKQSILLFLPSIALYALLERRSLKWRWGSLLAQQLAGGTLLVILISPMIFWNARHGWPMLAHTLGHLGAGGDQAGHVDKGNALIWSSILLGGVVAAIGPAALALMIWASIRARSLRATDPTRWRDRLWLICAAWPAMIFFLLLSFTKPVIPSWPLPSFVPLAVLAGELIVVSTSSGEEKLRTLGHQLWSVLWIYSVVGWLVISFPTPLGHVPWVGPRISRSFLHRFTGHRDDAQDLAATLTRLDRPVVVVTRHYMAAGVYSFYLPSHPVIHTAGKQLGKRSTTFDQ